MSEQSKQYSTLLLDKQGATATITLNRPKAANGLNYQMATELADAAQQCAVDKAIKAVILTGSGRFFCAGGDMKSMLEYGDNVETGLKSIADQLHRALSTLARMDAPLVVAVNGTAAGAGFSAAIAGDLVVAAESASFTMAYTKVGLSPDGSSSYYLPRLVGLRRAQELMYTNRVLSATEALEWGLVNKVVADQELAAAASQLADMLVAGSKGSNSAVKQLLLQTFNNSVETQMELESRAIATCAASDDGREGVAAFLAKRKPEFA